MYNEAESVTPTDQALYERSDALLQAGVAHLVDTLNLLNDVPYAQEYPEDLWPTLVNRMRQANTLMPEVQAIAYSAMVIYLQNDDATQEHSTHEATIQDVVHAVIESKGMHDKVIAACLDAFFEYGHEVAPQVSARVYKMTCAHVGFEISQELFRQDDPTKKGLWMAQMIYYAALECGFAGFATYSSLVVTEPEKYPSAPDECIRIIINFDKDADLADFSVDFLLDGHSVSPIMDRPDDPDGQMIFVDG